ncbi:MAG: hypothetical protein WDW38_006143 [Sanguina aurantia]
MLCAPVLRAVPPVWAFEYLKPVQTGFPADSDARLVARASGGAESLGPHAAVLTPWRDPLTALVEDSGRATTHASAAAAAVQCTVMHAWALPASPHLAVAEEAHRTASRPGRKGAMNPANGARSSSSVSATSLILVETAGGVASPAPSGSLQCDVMRRLRLPGILVGDARLGGISATVTAYEALLMRGMDVEAVVLLEPQGSSLYNATYLRQYLASHSPSGQTPPPVIAIPACPPAPPLTPVSATLLNQHSQQLQATPASQPHTQPLDSSLAAWLQDTESQFQALASQLTTRHAERRAVLRGSASAAQAHLWWPFTQHATMKDSAVQVIDSRCGEEWAVFLPPTSPSQPPTASHTAAPSLSPHSSSSHQTSGDSSAATASSSGSSSSSSGSSSGLMLNPGYSLWKCYSRCMMRAAAGSHARATARLLQRKGDRSGHVMFPQVAHAPALELTQRLINTVGAGWANRVFFSDDGSTAIEVALKMAFRSYLDRQGLLPDPAAAGQAGADPPVLQVLGLQNAYHGDTLGAVDCVAPSVFNTALQAPWYSGRGLFLHPPYITVLPGIGSSSVGGGSEYGCWGLHEPPAWLQQAVAAASAEPGGSGISGGVSGTRRGSGSSGGSSGSGDGGGSSSGRGSGGSDGLLHSRWASLDAMAAGGRDSDDPLGRLYRRHIDAELDRHVSTSGGAQIGACVIEPVLQGAGGMLAIDPLFQRAMVQACRARGIPVIFDEVFTGLFRLGSLSAAQLLGVSPDIGCYGKMLTGGLVPMAVTLASEAVFDAFQGPSKLHALLHGHSYTAYPLGCGAAVATLKLLTDGATNPNLCTPDVPGRCAALGAGPCAKVCRKPCGRLLPVWDDAEVGKLSGHPMVVRLVCLGTVLAVELRDASTACVPSGRSSSSSSSSSQGDGARGSSSGGPGAPGSSPSAASSSGDSATRYAAGGAMDVVARLRSHHAISARPLGNVVYLMCLDACVAGDVCASGQETSVV